MAVHRNGERITTNLENLELKAGDNLMLLTTDDFTRYWGESRVFYMASEIGEMDDSKDRRRRWIAMGLVFFMIAGATAGRYIPAQGKNEFDMFFFAAVTVVLMALMKIYYSEKVYQTHQLGCAHHHRLCHRDKPGPSRVRSC